MVGDKHAVELISPIDLERAHDVDIAFIEKHLVVMRHLAAHVPQMHVCNGSLPAVRVNRVVHISALHFGNRALAKLQRVGAAGHEVQ
jgi:hypothetical protein